MDIIFNSRFLQHNPGNDAEGPYRIEGFKSQTREVDSNGERYITLVHRGSSIIPIRSGSVQYTSNIPIREPGNPMKRVKVLEKDIIWILRNVLNISSVE